MDVGRSGGSLLVPSEQVQEIKAASLNFLSIALDPAQLCDLELLLSGAYAPLGGYMGREDFESVLASMRLADGTPWPLPVSLAVTGAVAEKLSLGQKVALRDGEGFMVAVLTVGSLFEVDPAQVARAVFGPGDLAQHPGAAARRSDRTWRVGGLLEGLALPGHCDFTELRRTPAATRDVLARQGWSKVLGVQLGRFPHRGDQASILEAAERVGAAILLLQPAGEAMAPSLEHFAAVRCARHFAARLPASSTLLGLLPYRPLGAGPRQALLEAILLRNHGCTHFLVSRHQADPLEAEDGQTWYPAGAAQGLVEEFAKEIGIAMVAATPMVSLADRDRYVPAETVSPGQAARTLSASELRRRLEFGLDIPDWYAFPEMVRELRQVFPPRSRQGFTLFMTGLPGAGKSTLAKLLYVALMERLSRPVSLLDGDIVRRHLSSELTFSKAHRNLNIERIGFVASEITKNGGIALCAPIAPYASSRRRAREMVSQFGGFVEIHMATPLAVCERRDRKGLYAKARAGVIKGVTGIDDPYEVPEQAEIVVDATAMPPEEAVRTVLGYLTREGYLA